MTAVLMELAMTPQAQQERFPGSTTERGKAGAPAGFEALLPMEEETDGTWDRPQGLPVVEQTVTRPQGPQLPRQPHVWPTAAMPARPPFDGQALTASAPASPDGRPTQVILDPWSPSAAEPMPLPGQVTRPSPARRTPAAFDAVATSVAAAVPVDGGWTLERTPVFETSRPLERLVTTEQTMAMERLSSMEQLATTERLPQLEPAPLEGPSTPVSPTATDPTALPEPAPSLDVSVPPSPDADNRPVLVRPQTAPQAPAEPMTWPTPSPSAQVDPDGNLRIELDPDLAVEVRPVARGVEVTLDGTPQALQSMAGLEQELDAALDDAGSHLDQFTQRRRDPKASPRPSDDDGNAAVLADDEPTQLRIGASLIHVVA